MEAGILSLVGHGGAVKRCLAGTSLIFLRMLTEATACNFRKSAFNGPVYLRHDVMPDLTVYVQATATRSAQLFGRMTFYADSVLLPG